MCAPALEPLVASFSYLYEPLTSTTSRSTRPWSTASPSRARWSWATCIGPILPTRWCLACVSSGMARPVMVRTLEDPCETMRDKDLALDSLSSRSAGSLTAEDAGREEGRGGIRGAEMLGVPLNRRQGQQGEPARWGRHEAVGRGHRAWIVNPIEMAAKVKSTKKPPMTAKYGKLPAADIDALVAYMQSLK